jgi:uncharacterized protein (DUF2062 family)
MLERVSSSPIRRSFRQQLRGLHAALFPPGQAPLAVSISVFLGVFIGVMPTIGVALPLTVLATALFRVPKGPGLVASFVATPPTLFLFYFPLGYLLGQHLLAPPPSAVELLDEVRKATLLNVGETCGRLWLEARPHLLAFAFGITIVSLITALACAAGTYWFLTRRAKRNSLSGLR